MNKVPPPSTGSTINPLETVLEKINYNFPSSSVPQYPSKLATDYFYEVYKRPSTKDYIINNTERLLRFDTIRLNKLVEILEYASVYFVFTFVIASFIDSIFPAYDQHKKTYVLFLESILQLLTYILVSYYVKKLIYIIPPIVFANKYIPSMKQESNVAITIIGTYGLILMQNNLRTKISAISYRLFPRTAPVTISSSNVKNI